jgi:excisionase family DNA binding protein
MEGYMHVAEAARELGLTRRAILARIERGEMRAERVHPKLWLIPIEEVDRWRGRGKLKPGPKPSKQAEEE